MKRFLDFQFGREVRLLPLFLNHSLRNLAISLLSLFSLIYIYKTLLSLTGRENLALLGVFSFFLGFYVFKFLSILFAEELSLRLGLKKQIYLGLLFLVLCLLILSLAQGWPPLLFLASSFWGLATGFYWFGWHGLMVKDGRREAFGKELGIAGVVSTTLLLGAPFLGGSLITLFGYPALFAVSLFFALLSALSLRSVKEERTHRDTSLKEVIGLFRTHKRVALAYVGDSAAATIYSLAIPLYLFLILGEELSLGGFFSLSMILVALINLMIGRWIDIRGKRAVLAFGSAVSFLVWTGRALTRAITLLLVLDVADQATAGMTGIPLIVWTYEKALDGHSTGRAILFREVAIFGGAVLACLLLIILALLNLRLECSFLAAAIFSLSPLLSLLR